MSLARDMVTQLVTAGEIDGTTWHGREGYLPRTPDKVVAIFETGGLGPIGRNQYREPTFQARIRTAAAEGHEICAEKALAVLLALHNEAPITINASVYNWILAQSDLIALPKDDLNRQEFTVNFRAAISMK